MKNESVFNAVNKAVEDRLPARRTFFSVINTLARDVRVAAKNMAKVLVFQYIFAMFV